jgi:hypothetical protein
MVYIEPMIKIFCKNCKKEFSVYRYRAKTAKFCSSECFGLSRIGKRGTHWKGGRVKTVNGYILIRVNGHYIYEHRLVMEKILGRKLKRFEHVHHVNGNKADNGKENLELIDGRSHNRRDTRNRWKKNPASFLSSRRRCLKPSMDRHHRGKLCQRYFPCSYHPAAP